MMLLLKLDGKTGRVWLHFWHGFFTAVFCDGLSSALLRTRCFSVHFGALLTSSVRFGDCDTEATWSCQLLLLPWGSRSYWKTAEFYSAFCSPLFLMNFVSLEIWSLPEAIKLPVEWLMRPYLCHAWTAIMVKFLVSLHPNCTAHSLTVCNACFTEIWWAWRRRLPMCAHRF